MDAIADSIDWAWSSRDMCVNWNELQYLGCASSEYDRLQRGYQECGCPSMVIEIFQEMNCPNGILPNHLWLCRLVWSLYQVSRCYGTALQAWELITACINIFMPMAKCCPPRTDIALWSSLASPDTCPWNVVWFPDPSAFRFRGGRGGRAGGRWKGLVNNLALARIHGSIPAVSVDEGKNTNLE